MIPVADGLRRPELLPVEDLLFESPLLRIGRFRCAPAHPLFADSGPIVNAVFAFPRTCVWIQHEGGEPFVADRTVATLYNRGQRYRRRALRGLEDCSDWFALAPGVLREIAASRDGHEAEQSAIFSGPRVPVDGATYVRQRALVDALRRGRADALWIEEQVLWLAARVLARDTRPAGRPPGVSARTARMHREQAEHARTVLNARYTEALSLAALGRLTGVSVFHLARVFRTHTGTTLHAYRQSLRLRDAVDRLNEPGTGLTGVALDLGFSSHSHFTAAFRQMFGTAPSAFRRPAATGRATRVAEADSWIPGSRHSGIRRFGDQDQ